MPDRFGPRGVVAVLIPVQNSNMQPEYEMMRPEGISNQMYRFNITSPDTVGEAVLDVVPHTLKCWPDMIVGGNSLEMRDWSVEKQAWYTGEFAERAEGKPFVLATDAVIAALRTVGAKRVGMMSPLSVENSKSAVDYYTAMGFDIAAANALLVDHPVNAVNVPMERVVEAFEEVDSPDIDTLLHVGGSLGIVPLVQELEDKFGKPVLSVNAATYWYALRKMGINDPIPGYGRLLLETGIVE
jgi:maleate isomerase